MISPESQLPFTVHERSGKLVLEDHTTGLRVPPPDFCPACKSTRLRAVGAGTERIEQIIRAQFPQARVVRADSDTVSTTEEMRNMLSVMHRREADILLGTQTVVKGLDLPHVTLSAVILADVGISLPHFRAGERIFQLMTQLAGRSGRAKPGEVLIQTFRPEAPEIRMAAEHHTEEFLNTELKMRVYAGYPPATEMIRLLYRGPNATHRAQSVYEFFEREKQQRGHMYKVSVSPTLFGGGSVWHVLLRGTDLRALLHGVELHGAVIDVDPLDCL